MPDNDLWHFIFKFLIIAIFTFLKNTMKKFYLLFSILMLLSCDTIPYTNGGYSSNESSEFSTLMEKEQKNKNKVTAEVLTFLLNETDPEDTKTASVIENTSNCNIILRLVGLSNNKNYNLPIPKHGKNQFVIEKGNYTMKSNICGAKYDSQKNITEPLILELSSN